MDYFICQGAQRFIRTKDICIICKMTSSGMFYAVTKVTDVNKRTGPRTEPWGTLVKIAWIVELWLLTDTNCFLLAK